LSNEQRRAIREAVEHQFGTDARVYLFGSRVDDDLRGGDIDLLVELEGIPAHSRGAVEAKFRTLVEIQRRIGERKIDLIVAGAESDEAIVANARRQAVRV
jgi:uncharacterized protein